MKCLTCGAEIPPAWVNAIQKNECPGCGGEIMNESVKSLMTELRDAIAQMPNADAESITGWLMSNYNFQKIGAAEPTAFHRKPPAGEHYSGPLKNASGPMQQFMNRSGADKVLQGNPKFAAIAQHINNIDDSRYGGAEEPAPPAEEQVEDVPAQPMVTASGKRMTIKESMLHAGGENMLIDPSAEPLSSDEAEMLQAAVGSDPDAEAAENSHPLLQQQRMQRLAAQRNIMSGNTRTLGSNKSIRRAD